MREGREGFEGKKAGYNRAPVRISIESGEWRVESRGAKKKAEKAEKKRAVPRWGSGTALEGKGRLGKAGIGGLFHGDRLFAVGAHAHGRDGAADELAHALDEFPGVSHRSKLL